MGKLYNELRSQLKIEGQKENAHNCIKIYNKLLEINGGSVWSRQWEVLTTIDGFHGKYPNSLMLRKPSAIGYVFLKGIEAELKEE